jgi:phosphoadenosine phosphosulfate reductase
MHLAIDENTLARPDRRQAASLDEALRLTDSLEDRIRIIQTAVDGRIAFSSSLGIEDQILFHAIVKANSRIETFTLDTGRHFPETYETLARTERVLGRRIRVVMPDAADVEGLVARNGIDGFRNSVENRKACCHFRKVLPLNRALAGAAAWVTGVRRDQSQSRDATPFAAFEPSLGLIKINPLADWPLDRVEAYAAEHDVPINRLHARGFPSIGCQPCTRAITPGEPLRAGRWWWENENHKECGLHNRPGFSGGGVK